VTGSLLKKSFAPPFHLPSWFLWSGRCDAGRASSSWFDLVWGMCSVQNRHLWYRFKHKQRLMQHQVSQRAESGSHHEGGAANERWLWHGTSLTPPARMCSSLGGVNVHTVCGVRRLCGFVDNGGLVSAVKPWVLWYCCVLLRACCIQQRVVCAPPWHDWHAPACVRACAMRQCQGLWSCGITSNEGNANGGGRRTLRLRWSTQGWFLFPGVESLGGVRSRPSVSLVCGHLQGVKLPV